MTPIKKFKYSTRQWNGIIKKWRRKLHDYDPPKGDEEEEEPVFMTIEEQLKQLEEETSLEELQDTSFVVDEEVLKEAYKW